MCDIVYLVFPTLWGQKRERDDNDSSYYLKLTQLSLQSINFELIKKKQLVYMTQYLLSDLGVIILKLMIFVDLQAITLAEI